MGQLSLGQKAIVIGIIGIIAILAVVTFVAANLLGKALALLVLGVSFSTAYKILHR